MTEQQQQQPESHLWSLHAASGDAAPEESSPRGRFTSKWSNKLMFQALGMKCSLLSQQFPYQEVTLKRSWLQEEPWRNTRWKWKQHFPSLTRSPISLLFPSLLPNHSGILSVRARTKGRQCCLCLWGRSVFHSGPADVGRQQKECSRQVGSYNGPEIKLPKARLSAGSHSKIASLEASSSSQPSTLCKHNPDFFRICSLCLLAAGSQAAARSPARVPCGSWMWWSYSWHHHGAQLPQTHPLHLSRNKEAKEAGRFEHLWCVNPFAITNSSHNSQDIPHI